jgi:hypothetical protein
MVNWPALLFSTQKNVTGGAPGSFGVEAPRKRIQEQSDFGPSPKSCYRKLTLTLLPFDNVIPRRTRNQIGFVLKSHHSVVEVRGQVIPGRVTRKQEVGPR